jgi:hypothetical protein
MLKTKQLSTSWYHRPQTVDTSALVSEHPQNIENAKKKGLFEAQVERFIRLIRYKQELQDWNALVGSHEDEHKVLLDAIETGAKISYTVQDLESLVDEEYKAFLASSNMDIHSWITKTSEDMKLDVFLLI